MGLLRFLADCVVQARWLMACYADFGRCAMSRIGKRRCLFAWGLYSSDIRPNKMAWLVSRCRLGTNPGVKWLGFRVEDSVEGCSTTT